MIEHSGVDVITLMTGTLPTSTHIIVAGVTCLIVDPAEPVSVSALLRERGLVPALIINTHGHYDHIGGNRGIKDDFGTDILISERDAGMLSDCQKNFSIYSGVCIESPPADGFLDKDKKLAVDGVSIDIIPTPGHSPGSVCLLIRDEGILFTGDTLFDGGVGRTDLPGGDQEALLSSLNLLKGLDPGLTCYPGHGHSFKLSEQFGLIDYLTEGV